MENARSYSSCRNFICLPWRWWLLECPSGMQRFLSFPKHLLWCVGYLDKPPLLFITSGCSPSESGDFSSQSIEITLLTSSKSEHLCIQCWVGLWSMLSTACCSSVDILCVAKHEILAKWKDHFARISCFSVIIFTNPSARAGCDTRSIFKQSLTGFPSPRLVVSPRLKNLVCPTIYL